MLAGAICHNDLTCKTDIIKNLGWDKPKGGGIRDVDVDQIDWYLERTYGLKNYKAIGKALNIIASQNHFHPIKERLESLEWDGVSRIADVLPKYLGADQGEYTTEIMLLLMQAAIHRIYDPGCKFEIMVCLVDRTGNRRFAPIMVYPERVEKHILEDEHESREYIKQLWAEMIDFYYKRSWKRNILVVFGLCKQSKQEKIKRQKWKIL